MSIKIYSNGKIVVGQSTDPIGWVKRRENGREYFRLNPAHPDATKYSDLNGTGLYGLNADARLIAALENCTR